MFYLHVINCEQMENRWINLQRVTKVTQETKEMQDLNNLLSERERKIKSTEFGDQEKLI